MGKKFVTPELPSQAARQAPVEPEKVTAPVTAPTEDPWAHLEIPEFLRRVDTTPPTTAPSRTPSSSPTASAPVAVASAGGPTGPRSEPTVIPGLTGGFDQFRVDPEEIESKIRHEADRQWRAWVPTKEHLSRPRKSYYLKQVRKEYYP